VVRAVRHQASFLVATKVRDLTPLSDQELIQTDKDQHSVERGVSFRKDPLFLFLASSGFVKTPERIVARSLVMVLCLLVYRLAEHRLRAPLAATGPTIPSQLHQPTARPTMRWVFPCCEEIDLLHLRAGPRPATALVLWVQPGHQQVLALLGPAYEEFSKPTN
jgi:transposase